MSKDEEGTRNPEPKSSPNVSAVHVTSPKEFFGFKMGEDRKMARWDKIVQYFYKIQSESDRIKVIEMGKTTEGNPFVLVIISSPENLSRLDELQAINRKITDPRGLSEEEVKTLVKNGKAVVCQSMSLHATEIGGTQMSPELAYDLITADSESSKQILDNVVFLMVPCFNPDGEIMVADWYKKCLDTEWEGTGVPWLYHKYAGHDNNRDAFALNLPESRYMAEILFTKWRPHAYQDHHHMGSNGARLYLAPYSDAIRPYADPLVWREDAWYGAHMAYSLEEEGKTGILNGAQYPGWGHFGFHWITTHHNIAGMLTESASAKLATPIYIHPHQLKGASAKTMPRYEAQTNFPHPWPGGWWRLRDIVEQQKIAAYALLEIAARFKEKILWNAYLKAKRQTERGAQGSPEAFVIPSEQNDPLTCEKLVALLLAQGIEIKRSLGSLISDGRIYPPGSYVISLAQPKMGVIKSLLGRTFYPDSYWTRNPDGSPIMYDTATDTLGEFMGVKVLETNQDIQGDLVLVREGELALPRIPSPVGGGKTFQVEQPIQSEQGYLLDPRLNDSFTAVNRLLAAGVKCYRLEEPLAPVEGCCDSKAHRCDFPAGAFYVEDSPLTRQILSLARKELGVPYYCVDQCGRGGLELPVSNRPAERSQSEKTSSDGSNTHGEWHGFRAASGEHVTKAKKREIKTLKVGMYQRYWGGNIDEGWTRYVLESFEFPYVTLKDKDIQEGNLRERLDVIILPSDRSRMIIGPDNQEGEGRSTQQGRWPLPNVPPEYKSGLGKDGVKALKEFVEKGGRLLAFDGASDFAIEYLGLRVRNVVANTTFKEFYCHGSTLRASVDTNHPYGYGMPDEALVMNFGSPAFEVVDFFSPENYRVIAEYPEKDLLMSGWLIGEDRIAKKPCMISVKVKDGEVVLFGFRPQFRGQTHGTFKLLFNCLM